MKRNKKAEDEIFTPEERAIIKRAFAIHMQHEFDQYDDSCEFEFSDRFKRKMNGIFREVVGPDRIPHPEVEDNKTKSRC